MKLTDHYDGSNDPFEGDRTLLWTSLPAGAKVSKAKLTLAPAPVSPPGGVLFQEDIRFSNNQRDWSATKATGGNGNPYVEIDFHKRRTLVSVDQVGLGASSAGGNDGASFQIDMGGVFVEINSKGAIKTPTDPSAFSLPAPGASGSSALPSLTVSKFRLIASAPGGTPDITRVVIRSVPGNINVRLGKMGVFWPRPGDLVEQDVSPDFADVLQVFLNHAEIRNGFYVVPLVVHCDTIARLQADLQVEYIQQASVMPDGVSEVVLPFDFSSVPNSQPGVLSVSLPPNAQVVPTATTAKVLGAFDDTRVVYGPTGEVSPAGTVPIAANDSQAELFLLDNVTAASGVDLFIAVQPPGAVLEIDVRNDLDGKPDTTSLLSAPVQVTVASKPGSPPAWVNVPLGQEVHFQAKDQARYWLVIQSLQGLADWSVQPASGETAVMQHTQDGGHSWRETPAPAAASPPSGLFRLRSVPPAFQVPIDLQIGSGSQAQRVKLDRFQPLGRVDFSLNIPEVSSGFNAYLSGAPATCSEVESLANGSFQQLAIVGNDPGSLTGVAEVALGNVGAIAVSNDGKTAYVGMSDPSGAKTVLAILDAACNTIVGSPITIAGRDLPQRILLYPDQTKALVMGSSGTLILLDLLHSSQIKSVSETSITTMLFNTDGSRLYFLAPDGSATGNGSTLSSIDTATFEKSLNVPSAGTGLEGPPVALAADQHRLYALTGTITTSAPSGNVFFVDPQTLIPDGDPVQTGHKQPLALAVSPDGSHAVVASGDNTVTIINTQHKSVISLQLGDANSPPASVAAVAISPDGKRAFVATIPDTAAGFAITIVDLVNRSVLTSIPTTIGLTSIALTPQGDQLYVGTSGGTPLSYLPLGVRVPADWFLTSGEITMRCLPQASGAHVVAELGRRGRIAPVQPSALSQVAPISGGGCTFDFSLEGLTNDPQAVAEVLWRGQDCQGVKTDSVPIPQMKRAGRNVSFHAIALPTLAAPAIRLVPARARLTAPPGATSAEVRFSVPEGVAVIAIPSLIGTSQALLNTGLEAAQPGAPDRWTLSPATAGGFLTTATGSEVVLRNTGPDKADLVQAAPVTAGQSFTLNFTGRTVASNASESPTVGLHWLKSDGTDAATTLSEEIASETFDSHPIGGQVPTGASQVEVHLSLPSGTALAVDEVSLRMPKTTSVPVSFVAQSPGQLRISGAEVGYDSGMPSPPPVPAGGLCPPTPPGQKPGRQPPDSGYCSCCQAQTQMTQHAPATTPAGRPMTVGRCADCGNQLISGGGQPVPGAVQPLTLRVVPAHPARPTAGLLASRPAAAPALTDVLGIGKARARQLKRAGIKSVRNLAGADPEYVAEVVRGVSPDSAAQLIEHAKKMLANYA